MKVLFTPHIEHYTIGLSQELAKHVNLTLLSTKQFNTKAKQIVIPDLSIPHVKGLIKWIYCKVFSHTVYDVIHVNSSQEGLFVGKFDKLIVTEHAYPNLQLVHEFERKYYIKEREAILRLHKVGIPIITISNYNAKMLQRTCGIKVYKVIYHGLLRRFLADKPKSPKVRQKILWVSRLVPEKEPMVFLEALTRIRGKIDFKAIIGGDGPLANAMTNFVHTKGLEDKVIFKGKIPFEKLPELYGSSTISVHTSSHEAFGMAVLEAMRSSLPVIVPKSGGAYEVAESAALTFNPHDPVDLAEKILTLAYDASLYETISRKCLEKAKEFTWEKAAKDYLKVYEKRLQR